MTFECRETSYIWQDKQEMSLVQIISTSIHRETQGSMRCIRICSASTQTCTISVLEVKTSIKPAGSLYINALESAMFTCCCYTCACSPNQHHFNNLLTQSIWRCLYTCATCTCWLYKALSTVSFSPFTTTSTARSDILNCMFPTYLNKIK